MNFSFIIKTIFVSFFVFLIIYAISFVSIQNDSNNSNNFGVKNTVKEALNIGELRANDNITFDDEKLLIATIENYVINNNLNIDKVRFDVFVNSDVVTVKIYSYKNTLEIDSDSIKVFSYQVIKR